MNESATWPPATHTSALAGALRNENLVICEFIVYENISIFIQYKVPRSRI